MSEKKQKNKIKGRKRRFAWRIIAAIIAILMVLATASTFIFYIINYV